MRAMFRKLRFMQSTAEQDVKDKQDAPEGRRKKVDTFLSDFGDSLMATRDDVARLLGDIESDLEGDENRAGLYSSGNYQTSPGARVERDPTESWS